MRVPEIDLRAKPHKESQPRANGGLNYWIFAFGLGLFPGTAGVALRFSLTFDSPRRIRDSR